MTEQQKVIIRSAYADLVGAYQAHIVGDQNSTHAWDSHLETIHEMEDVFPFIDRVDLISPD